MTILVSKLDSQPHSIFHICLYLYFYTGESSSSSSNPSPTKQSSSLSTDPTPTKHSSSSSSNPTPTKQKTGCEISSFLKFKDWIENTTFIIRDEAGDVSHSVQYVVILDRQAGMMDWPGSYIGCQNCKTTHTASKFGNDILQVPWTQFKTNPVQLDIVRLLFFPLILLLFVLSSANPSKRFSNMCPNSSCYPVWEWCNETVHALNYPKCTIALYLPSTFGVY